MSMASLRPTVFDIPRKQEHLTDAQEGQAEARYQPVSASKDVSGDQLTQGVHRFRFDTSGCTWFIPSMCYIRLRCSLTQVPEDGGDPLPPLVAGQVALKMGQASNLFKALEVRLHGQTIERVAEQVPQVDALKLRTKNTGAWLNSVARDSNLWAPEFETRQQQVALDGYLGSAGLVKPSYGPRLTQVEAGFHVDHLIRYQANLHLLTFEYNGEHDIDIMRGPMALPPVDRLGRHVVALQIDNIIDATHAFAKPVVGNIAGRDHIHDGMNPPGGVNNWYVHRLHEARSNESMRSNEFEIL